MARKNTLLSLHESRFSLARINFIRFPCFLSHCCSIVSFRWDYMATNINIDTWYIARRFRTSATCLTCIEWSFNIPSTLPPSYANSTGVRPKFRWKVSAINGVSVLIVHCRNAQRFPNIYFLDISLFFVWTYLNKCKLNLKKTKKELFYRNI